MLLEVERLSVTFPDGTPALQQVSFRLEAGSITTLTGPVGSGTSTLLACLNGVVPQLIEAEVTGRVLLEGADLAGYRVATISGRVGLVGQDPSAQILGRTVAEDVAFGPRNHLVPAAELDAVVAESLAAVGLAGFQERLSAELSGGELARLAIAGALAQRPVLLCLDDPTAALDPTGAADLIATLQSLRSQGCAVIVATHDARVHAVADARLLLDAGRLVPDLPVAARPTRLVPRPSSGDGVPAVTVNGLSHVWADGRPALSGISFEIAQGECLAVVGRNGAGKTTLVRHLNNLLEPSAGSVAILGESIRGVETWRLASRVGFAFQNPDHQLFSTTIASEVGYGPSVAGLSQTEVAERVAQALALTGLTGRDQEHPRSLSLPERHLVALASVLALRPSVLVVDEPTAGLDAGGIAVVTDLLDRLRESGTTVVWICHDLDLVSRHATRVAVLEAGRLLREGPAAEVLAEVDLFGTSGLSPVPSPGRSEPDPGGLLDAPFVTLGSLRSPSSSGSKEEVLATPPSGTEGEVPSAPQRGALAATRWSRLDLRTRVGIFVATVVATSLSTGPAMAAGVLFVQFLLLLGGRIPLRPAFAMLAPLSLVLVLIVPLTAIGFGPAGHGELDLGPVHLGWDGALTGLTMALRITTMVLATAALLASSSLEEVLVGLDTVRAPGWLAMLITTSLAVLPGLAATQHQIQQAQTARGARPGRGGPLGQVVALLPLMVPLIAHALTLARHVAVALSSRGYGAHRRITVVRRLRFTWRDALAATGVLLAGVLVWWVR